MKGCWSVDGVLKGCWLADIWKGAKLLSRYRGEDFSRISSNVSAV